MVHFYFIDSNIIMGYCNPLDKFHDVANAFFSEKEDRRTFLLFSIQQEFNKKILKEINDFTSLMFQTSGKLTFPRLEDIIRKRINDSKFQNQSFLKYILNLFKKNQIDLITPTSLLKIQIQYIETLYSRFNTLVKNWIKRPHMDQHQLIFKDNVFLHYYDELQKYIHEEDAKHLSLACYEVRLRNRRNREHEYYFYTNDQEWIYKNLESIIKIKNFHIKKILYRKSSKKGFNVFTQSFNIDLYEYIPDNL
ncbi:MAG: hypothetical protein ACTSQP_23660 [Promethearchaeota archaeon]